MEWTEFQQLEPNDKVMTEKYGIAIMKKWRNDKRLECYLYFSKPNRHCKWYARTEIKEKL